MKIMPNSIRVFPEEKGIKSHKITPRESDTYKKSPEALYNHFDRPNEKWA